MYRQVPDGIAFDPMLLVRTDGERAMDPGTLRGLVRELDAALVLDSIMTMDDRVMTSLVRPRAYALVLAALATLALAVAGVGLFGVLSYTTAQRTPEIGVRVALGARPRDVAGMVLQAGHDDDRPWSDRWPHGDARSGGVVVEAAIRRDSARSA